MDLADSSQERRPHANRMPNSSVVSVRTILQVNMNGSTFTIKSGKSTALVAVATVIAFSANSDAVSDPRPKRAPMS